MARRQPFPRRVVRTEHFRAGLRDRSKHEAAAHRAHQELMSIALQPFPIHTDRLTSLSASIHASSSRLWGTYWRILGSTYTDAMVQGKCLCGKSPWIWGYGHAGIHCSDKADVRAAIGAIQYTIDVPEAELLNAGIACHCNDCKTSSS